jgi:hypothetical protein
MILSTQWAHVLRTSVHLKAWIAAIVVGAVAWGCAPLISPYDHAAYQQATAVKAEAMALADKSIEPFEKHEAKVESLLLNYPGRIRETWWRAGVHLSCIARPRFTLRAGDCSL